MAVWAAVLGVLGAASATAGQLGAQLSAGLAEVGITGGYLTAAEVGCGLGLFWKALGTILSPALRSYVSRSPSLGFLQLLTLRRAELGPGALSIIDKALRKSLPLKVTRVYVGSLQLSVGAIVGLRVRADCLRVELEWTSDQVWENAAQDVREAELGTSQSSAQADIGVIDRKLSGKGPVPAAVAGVVESFIRNTRASLRGVEIVIQGQEVPAIQLASSLFLSTSGCGAIERKGAKASMSLQLSASAAGQPLLSGMELELKKLELPRVVKTLLAPGSLATKKVSAELVVKKVGLEVRPCILSALTQASGVFSRFSEWKEVTAEEAQGTMLPLNPGEKEEYEKALSKGEDVTKWEQRMIPKEILDSHCRLKKWPVPDGLSLGEWLAELKEEQKPVRAVQASAEVQHVALELLGDADLPGQGVLARLSHLGVRAAVVDPLQSAQQGGAESGWAASSSSCGASRKLTTSDSGSLGAFDAKLLRDAGDKRLEAKVFLGSLEIVCDPPGSLAVPILEPCSFSADCSMCASCDRDTLFLQARCSRAFAAGERGEAAVTCNFSSHALWRVQRVMQAVASASAAQAASAEDLEEKRLATQSRVSAKRRAAHLADVRRIFDQLDKDKSGELESDEVEELVKDLYGNLMTIEEIKLASQHLMQMLDADGCGAIQLDELQEFFLHEDGSEGVGTYGSVCPRLGEYVLPVPDNINLKDVFSRCVCQDVNDPGQAEHAEVLQLRWVRALQNYVVAESTWKATIGPELGSRLSGWLLHEGILATDFWNDPTFSLKKLDISPDSVPRGFALVCNVDIPGVSMRLADCQHVSTMPRIRVDFHHVLLTGGLQISANQGSLKFRDLSGTFSVKAEYWNDEHRLVEPFVEPWNLKLDADGNCMRVLADHHMVINVTPPLLQALTVAASSMTHDEALSSGASFVDADVRPVVTYVLNRTLLDVKVMAHGPWGASKAVEIGRHMFDEPSAVELETSHKEEIHHLDSGILDGGGQPTGSAARLWTLVLQGSDMGEAWQVDEEIAFSVTGKKTFRDASGKRLIVVDVSVDVHCRAPVVTLSGICSLQNMTNKTLVIRDPGDAFEIRVGPGKSRQAGVGGGVRVTLDGISEGQGQHVPIDEVVMPVDDVQMDKDTSQWPLGGGYKFVLVQHTSNSPDSPIKARTLVCVPMLRILNCMPVELRCNATIRTHDDNRLAGLIQRMRRGGQEDPSQAPDQSEADLFKVASGEIQGFDDIDPSRPIGLKVEVMGYLYGAEIPKDAIHDKKAASKVSHARRMRLVPEDSGAPHLEIDLGWEGVSAMIVIFARHWLVNKTGWELEAHCGAELPGVGLRPEQIRAELGQEIARPAALRGASWAGPAAAGADSVTSTGGPEVAFMRAADHKLRLKTFGIPTGFRWAWDAKAEGAELKHWIGLPSGQQSPGSGARPMWESGWSQPLATEVSNTSGEANLPGYESANGVKFPGGSLGVTIADLPPPFLRTRLITVAPRYVIRNDMGFAVRAWPRMGGSRRVPEGSAPEGLPLVPPGGLVALDTVPSSTFMDALRNKGQLSVPLVSFRLVESALQRVGSRASEQSEEQHEVSREPGTWSVHVPLSVVGDNVFTLSTGRPEDPFRVVRASVQLVGATMFIVLVKGKYEYVIRNFSLLHTLAFYQEDSKDKEDFAVLRPCTYRGFTFPDPDMPRDLRGRIAGAGKDRVVQYDIDDLSKTGKMTGLTLPGQRLLLDVAFHMSAGQRVLTFRDRRQSQRTVSAQADAEALVAAEQFLQRSKNPMDVKADAGARTPGNSQPLQQGGLGAALIELHVDLFLAGLHVCLVDTLLPVPQELLGFTVDYVQLVKPAGERAIMLEVHNFQCDEFGEGRVIFGPAVSGLNSQRSPEADVPDFRAQPLFSFVALGPRQSENPLYDPDKGLFTLQNVAVNLQALEAGLDVGRLLALALRLQSWTKALDLGEVSTARAASQTLLKVLAKGIPTPQKGGMTICYVGRMMVKPISLAAEIILKKRQKAGGDDDDDDDEDLEVQLRRLSAGLNPALRAIVSFFAKLGTAFAEASPRFSFSKLDLRPDPQSSAVLVSSVSKHYLKQLQWQVAGVLGSLQLLGDPVGLFGDVKEGFHLFFKKTAEELQGQRSSIGSGVHDLVGGTLGAALGSVATISGSVKDTLGTVAGGPIGEEKRAENLAEGIDMSLASLAGGISEAVTGLVEQPIEQYESDGCVGLVKGSAQGVLGVVTRPIEGLFGAAEKMAQGAEGQVRGTSRGYGGLRRPPRVDFCVGERGRTGHVGLQVLERGFFWPKWSLTVVSVSLPDVWMERRIKRLFVSLVHEGEEAESDVHITRSRVADTWALESIGGFCGPLQLGARAGIDSAEGRVGCLRGPFRIQVEVLVEGNLEMTMPFRVVIGQGRLPIRDFNDAMLSRVCDKVAELRFSVKAVGSPIMGAEFSKREGEVIGEVVASLSPSIDPKIMPLRFLPHTVGGGSGFEGLPKLGPAAAAPIGLEANAGGLLALEGADGVAPLALPLAVPVSRRS